MLKHMGRQEADFLILMSRFAKENEIAETLTETMPGYEGFSSDEFIESCHVEKRVYVTEFRRKGWPEWEKEYQGAELQALLALQKLGLICEKTFPLYYTHDYLDRYEISYFALSRLGEAFLERMAE